MNHLLSTVLLAFSSNIDNLGIGMAYGIAARRIGWIHNMLIALLSGTGTYVSMIAGEFSNNYMSEEVANYLGSGILILIGLYTIGQAFIERMKRVHLRNAETSPEIPLPAVHNREALALAFSLTFNNLGGGFGAGISHLNILLTTLLTMMLSFAAIAGGFRIGERATLRIPRFLLAFSSGLAIALVGIYEIFI